MHTFVSVYRTGIVDIPHTNIINTSDNTSLKIADIAYIHYLYENRDDVKINTFKSVSKIIVPTECEMYSNKKTELHHCSITYLIVRTYLK